MADDASYNTFLARANADPSAGTTKTQSTSQSRSKFDPTASEPSSAAPTSLRNISTQYVSDTDSDFEPVFFSYSGSSLPSVADFEKCLAPKGGAVDELSVQDFDPRGQYGDVIQAVKDAGTGQGVKVFRVEVSTTRVEYYILTTGERKLIGVVAKAVES